MQTNPTIEPTGSPAAGVIPNRCASTMKPLPRINASPRRRRPTARPDRRRRPADETRRASGSTPAEPTPLFTRCQAITTKIID
jgi:hypothetical protein